MFYNSDITFISMTFSHFSLLAINLKNMNKNHLSFIQLFWLSKPVAIKSRYPYITLKYYVTLQTRAMRNDVLKIIT